MGIPPTNHHITFISPARQPEGKPVSTILVPKGHNAKAASFMVCRPNGIPIIVSIIAILDKAYSTAIIKPPKTTHIIFSNIFIIKNNIKKLKSHTISFANIIIFDLDVKRRESP